jgi:maltose-binding protein MalE
LIRAQVAESVWPSAQFDGKTLGIPVTLEGLTLYYNKQFVDQQAVGVQALPTTWDDLLAQAQTSSARFGLTLGVGLYPTAGLFFASGNDLMRADGTDLLTNERALAVYLVQMARLYQQVQDSAGKLDYGGSGATFRYNEIAFWLNGTWEYAEYRKVMGDRFGAMPIPPVGATPWQPMTRATLLYVTANSRQLDAAISFGRFITQTEAQQQAAELASMIPIRSGVTISDPILAPIAAQLLEAGKPILPHPQLRLYWRVLQQAIDAVTVDGRAPDTVALETLVTIQTALRPPSKATPLPTATRRP